MADDQLRKLKQALLDAYGWFADGRIKKIDAGDCFIVDKRTNNDTVADRNVYGWFCSMFLEVRKLGEVVLSIFNIPQSDRVRAWLAQHGKPFARDRFKITIAKDKQAKLAHLAQMVEAITSPRRSYDTPHYKYAVPRVIDALETLQGALTSGWAG